MAYSCEYCNKGIQVGHNIRHHKGVAGGRWKRKAQKTRRTWIPNLHYVRVVEAGKVVRRKLCTKCRRRAERPKFEKKTEEKEQRPGKVFPKQEEVVNKEKKEKVKVKKEASKKKIKS